MKKTTTTTKFQIHAGASHADNADQIVAAVVLSTAEPPPEGIMVLKLNEQLKFNNHVHKLVFLYIKWSFFESS